MPGKAKRAIQQREAKRAMRIASYADDRGSCEAAKRSVIMAKRGQGKTSMMKFTDIIGQESLKHNLQSALLTGRLSHAYLFSGDEGIGKKMLARTVGAALLCQNPQETDGRIEPCGTCPSCVMVQGDTHPDLRIVQKEKTNYAVDEIREQVVQDIVLQPMIGEHRVYIIPEADRMGIPAQNALLKTLEEPPSYACLMLLSERPQALLPTIQSRTVGMPLKTVPQAKIEQYLMERERIPDYRARECATLAEGNVGRAIEYARSERFAEQVRQTMKLLTELKDLSTPQIMERLQTLLLAAETEEAEGAEEKKPKKKGLKDAGDRELARFLDLLITLTRDALVFKAGAENRLVFADGEAYDREMACLSWEQLYGRIGLIREARERLSANVNTDLVLELLFLGMRMEKTYG